MTSEEWHQSSPKLVGQGQRRVLRLLVQAAHREGLLTRRDFDGRGDRLVWRQDQRALSARGREFAHGSRLQLDSTLQLDDGPHSTLLDFAGSLHALAAFTEFSAKDPAWQALTEEMTAAVEVQAAAYAEALQRPAPSTWADFEAWTPEGHNLHPGAKTRTGFSIEEMLAYAPDFSDSIDLPWLTVEKSLLARSGVLPALFDLGDQWAVPVHPWQRRHILPQVYAEEWAAEKIRDLDRPPLRVRLSTSLRTVHPVDTDFPILKLSVGSLMTSTERSMSRHTVRQGPIYSRLLARVFEHAPSWAKNVSTMAETGGLSWADPHESGNRSRQLSLVLRERLREPDGLVAVPCSTLPQPCGANLRSTYTAEFFARGEGPLRNLRRYCDLIIPFHLNLYLEWGLALEAHLQNCVMLWSDNGPERLWLRDWGGLRTDPEILAKKAPDLLEQLDPASITLSCGVAARKKLVACLYANHLTEVVTGLVEAFELREETLWKIVSEVSRGALADGPDGSLAQEVLERPWPVKALLRMRLKPNAGDFYSTLDNPLACLRAVCPCG